MAKQSFIWEEIKKVFTGEECDLANPFMLNRLLSFTTETFYLAIDVNKYLGLPKWAIRAIYSACIRRKSNAPYISLPKKEKVLNKVLTQKISEQLCCSEVHAKQTIELLKRCGHKPETFFGLKKDQ